MPDYDVAPQKGTDDSRTELEQRDVRALTQYLTVIPDGGDVYSVVSQSGSSYRVDARESRCTCPDHLYNGAQCKHIRRVAFETGREAIPSWVDPHALPDDFAMHVNAMPVVATTDGGQSLEVDATGVDGDRDGETCLCDHTELGCFEHFRRDE